MLWNDDLDAPAVLYRINLFIEIDETVNATFRSIASHTIERERMLARKVALARLKTCWGTELLEKARSIRDPNNKAAALRLIAELSHYLGCTHGEIELRLDEALAVDGISDITRRTIAMTRVDLSTKA